MCVFAVAQVFGFISWALLIVIIERITRLFLTVVSWLVPEFVLEWVAKKWQTHVTPISRSMPYGILKRSPSFQSKLAAMDAAAQAEEEERHNELFYDTPELITKRGYPFEMHYAETTDGFILGLHRIPHGKFNAPAPGAPPRPVVYLMHGFLQSSEAWVAARTSLAFQLADGGFDVWLGNARGNKYSAGHHSLRPDQDQYWNFCIDDVAAKDLPAALTYVTRHTLQKQLAYVGFSQGTAVAFACFSTRFDIAAMVHSFIALAPATTAKGFSQPLLDSIAKLSPDFVFFLLGRRALFGSAFLFWQNLLTNPQLVRVIDWFILHMFSWNTLKIDASDKPVLYSHIYSMSSVKSVVHWFQIMKAQKFQRYQEWTAAGHPVVFANEHETSNMLTEAAPSSKPKQRSVVSASAEGASVPPACPSPLPSSPFFSSPSTHVYRSRVAQEYPLRQIAIPLVHIMWGSADHLPDTQWLLQNLPAQATQQGFEDYEQSVHCCYCCRCCCWSLRCSRCVCASTADSLPRSVFFCIVSMDFLYASEAKHAVWPDVVARCKKGAESAGLGLRSWSSVAASSNGSTAHAGSANDSAFALFRSAVLTRDQHRCVRCGKADASAEPLHTVSLLPRSDPAWLSQGHLLHGFETANGLTLCSACLAAFTSHDWRLAAQSADRLTIVDASGKRTLDHQPSAGMMTHWPTAAIIKAHIQWTQQQREGGHTQHDSALDEANGCAPGAPAGVQKRVHANGSGKATAHS